METTLRTFIAIPLPEALLAELAQAQRQLEQRVPPRSVRWVRPEGIHLTLKFLGDTRQEKLEPICAALTAVASTVPRSSFTVTGAGCFPNLRRPRVIWVGITEPAGWLVDLQDRVEAALAPLGYPPEGRRFTPHLTLGRVQRHVGTGDLARIGEAVEAAKVGLLGAVIADRFALIRSVLRPTGAEYNILTEFKLGS